MELAHRHRDLPGAGCTADIAAMETELTLARSCRPLMTLQPFLTERAEARDESALMIVCPLSGSPADVPSQ